MGGDTKRFTAAVSTGVAIQAELDLPAGDSKSIGLLLHGFSSGKASKTNRALVPRLLAAGMATVRLDFRGHYESAGDPGEITLSRAAEDAIAVMGRMPNVAPDLAGLPLRIFGTSFGGAVAAVVAGSLNPDVLALKSPAADLRDMQRRLRSRWEWWTWRWRGYVRTSDGDETIRLRHSFISDAKRYDLVKAIRDAGYSVVCVHGMQDETVPVEHSRRLVAAAGHRGRLVELGGADHHYSQASDFALMIDSIVAAMTEADSTNARHQVLH